jgi:hypothetical protein
VLVELGKRDPADEGTGAGTATIAPPA